MSLLLYNYSNKTKTKKSLTKAGEVLMVTRKDTILE